VLFFLWFQLKLIALFKKEKTNKTCVAKLHQNCLEHELHIFFIIKFPIKKMKLNAFVS